ncbi:MAG: hypothetical protein HYV59_04145 [Planctomycetes bacterium]|nr:hypothetical protein [Planctomycetota bacterium]
MSKILKGNYELENKTENKKETSGHEKVENFTEVFESSALEKLSGSIAFVLKSNKFLWGDEDGDTK